MAAEFVERLGARMRQRREELGLSMAEVARRMPGKVSENQVYRWELGKHQPKPDTLEAIAKVLDVTVAALMAPTPDKTATPDLFAAGDGSQLDQLEAKIDALGVKLDVLHTLIEQLIGDQIVADVERALDQDSQQPAAKGRKRAA